MTTVQPSLWATSSIYTRHTRQKIAIFCDFDGTITRVDLTDAVLEAFALPIFKDWEGRWRTGTIGSQECLTRQTELIQADPSALIQLARNFPIDEGIFELDRRCTVNHAPLTILSDGFDLLIQAILQQHKLTHIPVFANRLKHKGDRKFSLAFPHARHSCLARAGTCKCAIVLTPSSPPSTIVYIGDGLSDCCVATRASKVFAKSALLAWCQKHQIPCEPFSTLTEVAHRLFPEPPSNERTI